MTTTRRRTETQRRSRPEYLPRDWIKKVIRLRREMKLTQTELAEQVGVSFCTINRWENGRCYPTRVAWWALGRLITKNGVQQA